MRFSNFSRRILRSTRACLLNPRFVTRRLVIPGVVLALLDVLATKAATYTWSNPAGGSWGLASNWETGAFPTNPGDVADFSELGLGANTTVTLDADQTAGTLLFGDTNNAFNWTLANGSGGPWTLTLAASTGSPVIQVNNQSATISAILGGTAGFTKTGAGNLILTAANTYTGTTTVSGGTLTLDFSQAGAPAANIISNTSPASLVLTQGGTLVLKGNTSVANSQSFSNVVVGSGADVITLNQNGAPSLTLALGAITQSVGGTLNFSIVPNTTTTEVTTTNTNVNGILGPWATVGSSGSLKYATVSGSDIVAYTSATVASANLANVTTATANYTFSAAATLNAPATANTLQYAGVATTTALSTYTLTLNGLLNTGSGTLTFTSSTGGGVQIGATNELILQGGNVTVSAPISNNGSTASSLTYSGTGILTLNTNASTYTGTTTVDSGTVTLGLQNVLSSPSSIVVNGGTLGFSSNSQSVNGVTLTGGTISGSAGTALTSTTAFNLQSGTVAAVLGGSAGINKTTNGIVTISRVATLGTSGVNIEAGTIVLGVTNALTSGNTVALGSSTANTAGILDLHGFNQTVGTFTGTATSIVTNAAAAGSPSVLTVSGGSLGSTFGGVIQDGTGGISVVKSGAQTVTFTGVDTYTGGTTINNGTLILAGGNNTLAPGGAIVLGDAGDANIGNLQLGSSAGAINQTVASIARTSTNTGTTQKVTGGYYNAATPGIFSTLTVDYTNTQTTDNYVGFLGSGTAGATAANNIALTTIGAGTLELTPKSANTYIGGTNIDAGTLELGTANALPSSGAVNVAGGSLNLNGLASGAGAVTVVSGSIVDTVGGGALRGSSYAVQSGSISAVLADAGIPSSLTKTTSGTVTLSGVDTYTGGTAIDAGTLALGVANTLSASGAVSVSGGTLDLAGFNDTVGSVTLSSGAIVDSGGPATLTARSYSVEDGTINAVLGGAGVALTKISDGSPSGGTVTLTAANTYTGLTSVNGGTLNVSTVHAGGGAFAVADGATLVVNLGAAGQSLVSSGLTLGTSSGAVLTINLGSLGNATAPVISTGALTLNGTDTINVSSSNLSVGEFPLISYTGSIGGTGTLVLGTLPARVTANLDTSVPNEIQLDVTNFQIPVWTGAINGNWDIDDGSGTVGTLNWRVGTNTPTGYYQGGAVGTDSVIFDDTATGTKTVNLTTTLTPISITVNNDTLASDTYTFTGAGEISGATTLTKEGTGTLILANTGANNYSGTTTISGGVLQAGDGATAGAGQLGTGNIVLSGGTLELFRPLGDNFTLPNAISGNGTLEQEGGNTATVTGNNLSFSGSIIAGAGTLKLGSANGFGSAIVTVDTGGTVDVTGYNVSNTLNLNGGTVTAISGTGTTLSGSITLSSGSTFDVAVSSTLTVSGVIGGSVGLVKTDSGLLVISGNNNYAGPTTIGAGNVQVGNANALGSSSGAVTVESGGVLDLAGYGITQSVELNGGTLRSSTGAGGSVSGVVTLDAAGGAVDVPTGVTLTLPNTIGGAGALTKTSAGTLVLSGTNNFGGGTNLNAGTLVFSTAGSVPSTGSISFAAGTILAFDFALAQSVLDNNVAANFNVATIALEVNDGNNLNFSNYGAASLGAIGNVTYSGILTPSSVNYYLGGAGGTLTFAGPLTGPNNLLVGNTGTGTVILTQANTFTGGTTVTAGTLILGNAAALGPATNPLTVDGTLDLNGNNLTVGSLTAAAAGLITDNSTTAGTTILTDNTASGSTTDAGSIDNGANGRILELVKAGAGTLIMNKVNGSTYSGGTVVSGGVLQVRDNNAQVLPSGSNLTFAGTGTFNAYNNGTGTGSLTMGTLTFSAGEGTVTSDQASTGAANTLTFASAPTRVAGATGDFTILPATGGPSPSAYKVVFTSAPTTGQSLDGGIFFGGDAFAAYDPSGYVRALNYSSDSNAIAVSLTANQASLGGLTGLDVQLTGTGNITDQQTLSVRTLNIAGSNNLTIDPAATFTVSAGGILKTGGISTAPSEATISGGVALDTGGEGDLVFRTATAYDTLDVASTITNQTADGITASGSGILILSGANSFTGPINILGGTFQVGSATAFGTASGAIVVQAGAVLDLAGFTVGNAVQANAGTLESSTGAGNLTGTVSLTGANTVNVASGATLTLSNTISGSGSVTITAGAQTSPGTAVFSGTNSFTGNVTITDGTLQITNSLGLGDGPKTVSIANASRPSLALNATSGSINLDPSISLTTSSDGTESGGTLGAIVNVAGNNVINGGITLSNGGGGDTDVFVEAGSLSLTGNITAASNATTIRVLILDGPGNGTISGVIFDGGQPMALTKQGTGTWLVTGANTYSSATTITAGDLQVNSIAPTGSAQPLGAGTGPITLGGATTSGTLEYTGAVAANLERPITVSGAGGGVVINSGGAVVTLSGGISTSGRTLTLTGGAFDVTGQIAGTGAGSNLNVTNASVVLGNTNAYNGATNVTNGSLLQNGVTNALPSNTTLTLGEATFNTNGTYDLNGFDQTTGGLNSAGSGSQVVTNSGASGNNTLTFSGSGTYAGTIKDGATATTAVATTTGAAQVLAGANTYSGATTVGAGTLTVSGSLNGTTSVAVTGGTLGGTGTITTGNNGNVTVGTLGSLAPGGTAPGTLTLSLGTGVLDLSAATASLGWLNFGLGTTSDELSLTTGVLNLGSGFGLSDFNFTNAGGFGQGTYVLFATNNAILGTLGANVSGTVLGLDATVQLADGGNELVLNVVPEPRAGGVLLAGLGTLLGFQRWRGRSRHRVRRVPAR